MTIKNQDKTIAAKKELEDAMLELARAVSENIDDLVAGVLLPRPDADARNAARSAVQDLRELNRRWSAASERFLAAIAEDAK